MLRVAFDETLVGAASRLRVAPDVERSGNVSGNALTMSVLRNELSAAAKAGPGLPLL
jgi:hypothetical protein